MAKKFLLLFITIVMVACGSDDNSTDLDCSLVLCAAVDDTIYLQFLHPDNDEDLLKNGTINVDLIEIINEDSNEVTFTVEEFSEMGVYLAIPVSTTSFGRKSFTITIDEDESFNINFETSLPQDNDDCCGGYTTLVSFTIDNYSYDLVEPSPLPVLTTVYIPNLD